MSEEREKEVPQDPPLTLDLTACVRVLEDQQRAREDAARAKREAEENAQRLAEEQARDLAAHVLSQLPAALAAECASGEVRIAPPPDHSDPLPGVHGLVCNRLDAYFGFDTDKWTFGGYPYPYWQFAFARKKFTVNRILLTATIERMAREAAQKASEQP